MNDTERARFTSLIRARLDQIEAESAMGEDGRAVVELDQQSVGRLSRMDAMQAQAMAKAHQARREAEAQRLSAALNRIEAGEFGWCDSCGDAIAIRRLELNPAATLCVNCASG